MIHFVGGPAFSGKSEWLIANIPNHGTKWMVTGDTSIEPMNYRYQKLKEMRQNVSMKWQTQETHDLVRQINSTTTSQLAIDCITGWICKIAIDAFQRQSIDQVASILASETSSLSDAIIQQKSLGRKIWIASNEIGTTLPSPHPLERLIREVNGRFNCQLASMASQVTRLDFAIATHLKSEKI
jgi:adenosyl cobinamide kinase/adenosyl cobinamide phosphate guanylyltransferase